MTQFFIQEIFVLISPFHTIKSGVLKKNTHLKYFRIYRVQRVKTISSIFVVLSIYFFSSIATSRSREPLFDERVVAFSSHTTGKIYVSTIGSSLLIDTTDKLEGRFVRVLMTCPMPLVESGFRCYLLKTVHFKAS